MTASFFKTLSKNILILFLSFTAITGCGDDTVEDLSLTIKVNKNHIELSNYTSCVDNIEYIDVIKYNPLQLPEETPEKIQKIFCLYDSYQRPVEESIFEYVDENRIEPTSKIKKYLTWNDEQESLTITIYERDEDFLACGENYCLIEERTISFQ